MINLEEKIQHLTIHHSDINEHIPTIVRYGKECKHITEMGVRGIVSTWGWLHSKPETLVCYDLQDPGIWGGNLNEVRETAQANGVNFIFHQANVLEIEIEETDLLFIDTLHTYTQLSQELKLHANKARKYICFHDTTSFEFSDECGNVPGAKNHGLWPAIEEFLQENPNWILKERYTNNNGFTILERI